MTSRSAIPCELRRRLVRLASCCVLVGFGAPKVAAAEPRALELRWAAPPGCPQEGDLSEKVRALTGPLTRSDSLLEADGTITRAAGRFHLRLVIRYGSLVGERSLDSDSCTALAGAAAVTLGLLLQSDQPLTESELRGNATLPEATSSNPRPAADAADAQTAAPNSSGTESTTPSDQNPKPLRSEVTRAHETQPIRAGDRRWHALAELPALAASLGLLPQASVGIGVRAGLAYDDWRFRLGGIVWLSQQVDAPAFAGYGAHVQRANLELSLCHALGSARLELSPCLVLGVERIAARGFGDHIAARTNQKLWPTFGVAARGALHVVDALALFVEPAVRVETERALISLQGLGNVRKLGPAEFLVELGTEWVF